MNNKGIMEKIKLTDIAKAANVSQQAVSNIITGRRRPSWRLATHLEDATGISAAAWAEGLIGHDYLNENYDTVIQAIRFALREKHQDGASGKQENGNIGFEELNGGCGAGQQPTIAKQFSAAVSVRFNRQKIVELRNAYGFSSAMFARIIGKLETDVVRWEFGLSVPDLGSIEKICSLFAVSPGCFFESEITPVAPDITAREQTA